MQIFFKYIELNFELSSIMLYTLILNDFVYTLLKYQNKKSSQRVSDLDL